MLETSSSIPHESERLAELDRYAILSSAPEETYHRLVRLAARLLSCPMAAVGFATADGIWMKSAVGLEIQSAPRASWFRDKATVIPDAEVGSFPAAWGPVRFYAGVPLTSPRGYWLGTLSVMDTVPHPAGVSAEEMVALEDLAATAVQQLESRLIAYESNEVKEMLQTTLASIGDGVIAADREGRVTFMNSVAEQLTGWSAVEARLRPIQDVFRIVNEDTRAAVENPVVRAIAEACVIGLENHTILITREGREIPIDDSGSPIRRGDRISGGVLIFRDVTKRREAERLLAHSENQFRRTFAHAPLGLVLTHLDGRFIESNEAYRQLTGYSESELPKISFLAMTHPEEAGKNRELFQQLLREEIPSYELDKRIFNKQGELRWVRARAALLRDADGRSTRVIGLVEDVTEHKRADQRFRFLAESIPQMVWTATPDGLLDYVNAQGAQYFDLPQEALLGTGWLQCVHLEDQARAVQIWQHSLSTGEPYESEFRLRRGADDSWRLHLVRALPLIGEGGKPTHWFGTCTDVDVQHQAARQIDESRRRWRELLLQTPAAIAVLRGPEHVFDWVNPAYETLVGRPREQLLGRTLLEALPEVASQIYVDLLDKVFERGEPFTGTEAMARLGPPGALREVHVNFVYMPTRNKEGNIDGVFAHITDVTEMVTARKTIEEREGQFRTLAETIPNLAWMADATGEIFWYNQRWYDYTGLSLADVAGWGWQRVHDPEVLPSVVERWRGALESGEVFEMVFPLRSATGEFRPFLTRVAPIRDGEGKIVRWFGTNTDIADQQKTEEQLRRINRELEEFSYVASHDLQEPLRMVNIYTELLLQDRSGKRENEEVFAQFISTGVRRMEVLIRDLLEFSRSVHKEDLPVGAADLRLAFEDAVDALQTRIEETGATIEAGELPMARGDTSQLSHVFQNVLSNALKYQRAGEAPRIDVKATENDGYWTIAIRDNGIGFEQQHADRIFGLFKRLHQKEYDGTGLGLAICKRIVERYGGRMWAESQPGVGSTFYFTLPRAS